MVNNNLFENADGTEIEVENRLDPRVIYTMPYGELSFKMLRIENHRIDEPDEYYELVLQEKVTKLTFTAYIVPSYRNYKHWCDMGIERGELSEFKHKRRTLKDGKIIDSDFPPYDINKICN